jgi:glycosyltransferase involved in cell wall biosynthesis
MKLISIIVATYNAETVIKRCIESVFCRKDEFVEFIVIDGNSTDSTVSIIREYGNKTDYLISEPDTGIYDAWNKGLNIAQGQWIMFLGADDVLMPNAIADYEKFIVNNKTKEFDIISSLLDYVDENGTHLKYIGREWDWSLFKRQGMIIAHPGMLHNRKFFEQYGHFDSSYKYCADYELLLRGGDKIKAGFMNVVMVKMQHGGASFSIKAIAEAHKARYFTAHVNIIICFLYFLRTLLLYCRFKVKHFLANFLWS